MYYYSLLTTTYAPCLVQYHVLQCISAVPIFLAFCFISSRLVLSNNSTYSLLRQSFQAQGNLQQSSPTAHTYTRNIRTLSLDHRCYGKHPIAQCSPTARYTCKKRRQQRFILLAATPHNISFPTPRLQSLRRSHPPARLETTPEFQSQKPARCISAPAGGPTGE